MGDIIYYESEDGQIKITEEQVKIAHMTFKVEEISSGDALIGKPDQTVNLAFAVVGIFCIILGKIRSSLLSEIIDVNVLFSASNYFDLAGLFLILFSLLLTLPQKEFYAIQFKFKNGRKKSIILEEKEHYSQIGDIDKAINQALRFAEFRNHSGK